MREPRAHCTICPRLAAFRNANAKQHPDWFNQPVPAFGALDARLLIVGLAPGLRGANRTGRPFTGDFAGDLLYQTLCSFGFATGGYDRRADDGLQLLDTRITNAVKCVPPENKPTTTEGHNCRLFLADEIAHMPRLRVVLALGAIAHRAALLALLSERDEKPSHFRFGHGAWHDLSMPGAAALHLIDSYHCSRYNTNTGRLTPAMFEAVFAEICKRLRPA